MCDAVAMFAPRLTSGFPTLLFVSDRRDDLFELHRYLEGAAVLKHVSAVAEFDRIMSRTVWRDTDSLVIDLRTQPRTLRERFAACVTANPPPCRVLLINPEERSSPCVSSEASIVIVSTDLPASGLAAGVHFGLGRHDILIRVLLMIVPHLSELGRRVVTEILAKRFQHVRVGHLAAILGMHRTQLHHRLVAAGDPGPRQLIDRCYAITMAIMLADGRCQIAEAVAFMRNPDARVARDAVRRYSGMTFRELRHVARHEGGVAAALRPVGTIPTQPLWLSH